jgi:nucleoside-diphosphate-sugar epimerase
MCLTEEIKDAIEWVEGDLTDPFFCSEITQGVDIVIQCAGFISFEKKHYQQLMDVNHRSVETLVHAALQNNISQFIHVSSIAALGRSEKEETIDESSIWKRSVFNSDYAISKYMGEMEVWKGEAEGLQVAIINPSVILGAGHWGNGSLTLFDKMWNGLSAYPTGSTGWVDVRDVAISILRILEMRSTGKRYIISASNASYLEVLSSIAEQMNKKVPRLPVNKWMAEIAWRGASVISTLTGNKPFVEKSPARLSQYKYAYPNLRSKTDLKMEYIALQQTIKESVQAYLKSKNENSEFAILPIR